MATASVQYDYSDAQVLVTGGTSGIGHGIAHAFKAAGANVTVTGTRASKADYDCDLAAFDYIQLQLEDKAACLSIASHFENLDILINNAGASLPGGKDEWQPEVFEQAVMINLISAYNVAHSCKDLLSKSKLNNGGAIINIASLTSFFAVEMVPGYGAAKAGLSQMTKTLGLSWAESGIRANAIAAGMTRTRMTEIVESIPEMNQPILDRTPLKRWGTPEDIAGAALFLCSDAASFITGQTLLVDGGYSVVG